MRAFARSINALGGSGGPEEQPLADARTDLEDAVVDVTARPNPTPLRRRTRPSQSAWTSTFASGVWSDSVSAPVDRRCETSQPSTTAIGGAGAIGERAIGPSATEPHPFGIEVGVVLHHPRRDVSAVGEVHGDQRAGWDRCGATKPRQIERSSVGDIRLDVMRPTICVRPSTRSTIWQPSGRDAPGIDGLQADEALEVAALLLPDQLGPAGEVLLVQLDQRAEADGERLREPVGVLPDDEMPLLQPHDALRLDAEGADAEVGARLEAAPPTRAARTPRERATRSSAPR